MTPLQIEEAIELGLQLTLALVSAVRKGMTAQAALKHVHSIIAAKLVIDTDVDDAARGTGA
jgi:hypothetical protein